MLVKIAHVNSTMKSVHVSLGFGVYGSAGLHMGFTLIPKFTLTLNPPSAKGVSGYDSSSTGASIITYTILGVPYYNYSIMGPQNLF